MIACVSIAEENLSETLSTLEYASKARLIHNNAVLNLRRQSSGRDCSSGTKELVEALRAQIASMRSEMERQNGDSMRGRLGQDFSSSMVSGLQQELGSLHHRLESVLPLERPAEEDSLHGVFIPDILHDTKRLIPAMQSTLAQVAYLEEQLKECRDDLERDEEAFAAKVSELRRIKTQLKAALAQGSISRNSSACTDEERREIRRRKLSGNPVNAVERSVHIERVTNFIEINQLLRQRYEAEVTKKKAQDDLYAAIAEMDLHSDTSSFADNKRQMNGVSPAEFFRHNDLGEEGHLREAEDRLKGAIQQLSVIDYRLGLYSQSEVTRCLATIGIRGRGKGKKVSLVELHANPTKSKLMTVQPLEQGGSANEIKYFLHLLDEAIMAETRTG